MSPKYLFNAPAHHTIVFSDDEVYHGGDVLNLTADADPAWIDPRLVALDETPAEAAQEVADAPEQSL
jgi:hypothetical protein